MAAVAQNLLALGRGTSVVERAYRPSHFPGRASDLASPDFTESSEIRAREDSPSLCGLGNIPVGRRLQARQEEFALEDQFFGQARVQLHKELILHDDFAPPLLFMDGLH